MLEPSDLHAAVNRLLVGLGQILTAAVLLLVIALVGSAEARGAAVLSLALTAIGYALQLTRFGAGKLVVVMVGLSWMLGAVAVVDLIVGK